MHGFSVNGFKMMWPMYGHKLNKKTLKKKGFVWGFFQLPDEDEVFPRNIAKSNIYFRMHEFQWSRCKYIILSLFLFLFFVCFLFFQLFFLTNWLYFQ